MTTPTLRSLLGLCLALACASTSWAQCPSPVPVQGGALPAPLPLFPASNWWNLDISAAPVDVGSAGFISYINNGGTRRLHPDFGGEQSPGSVAIYGFPYAVVDGLQPKQAVTFQYWSESDGVDPTTGAGLPFYPIPTQAISQVHWVEGGAAASVDQRSSADRHLLMVDCNNNALYELYNVYYNTSQGRWYAGSGAYFDMNSNNRRPDGWTSADAAGLAILPGLVRFDEAGDPAVTEIRHALRVTVRATNGYVYPGSHRAGNTVGALPMGARLRLKTNVGGVDPAMRTSDPASRKIFRAMQKYGLIVADNGSDLYISGTFDLRWNNDVLNPAFSTLSASDFEVVQLGWNPAPAAPASLSAVSANPNPVVGGTAATGTITLTAAAPVGGASVSLASASGAFSVPASSTVPAGASAASFPISTSVVSVNASGSLSATYAGVTRTSVLTVTPAPPPTLATLALSPASVVGGTSATGTATLSAAAPGGGATLTLSSSNTALATVPASITIAAGAVSGTFTVATKTTRKNANANISASYGGTTRTTTITVKRR